MGGMISERAGRRCHVRRPQMMIHLARDTHPTIEHNIPRHQTAAWAGKEQRTAGRGYLAVVLIKQIIFGRKKLCDCVSRDTTV